MFILRILMVFIGLSVIIPVSANSAQWSFTPADVNALHSKPANYRIPYGNQPLQFGDLRLPSNKPGPYPVAIIIHGGCWMSKFADVKNTAALADALTDMGIATWNIEYRREDNVGGGWPGTFDDVGHAADFLKKIGPKYALDLNRIIVIGHSAGGHLALWLAARHRLPSNSQLYTQNPIALRGIIVLGGIPDLQAFRQQGKATCDSDVIGNLLGGPTKFSVRHYQEASPKALLPLNVEQILIYGDEDQAVPAKFGQDYMLVAKQKEDRVKLILVKGAGHHEYNVPNSITWPDVKSSILSLLHFLPNQK